MSEKNTGKRGQLRDIVVGKLIQDKDENLFWNDLQTGYLYFLARLHQRDRTLVEDAVAVLTGEINLWRGRKSLKINDGVMYGGDLRICARVWASGKIELEIDNMGEKALRYSGLELL